MYINKVREGKAAQAGLWAVFLFVTGAVAVVTYTANKWLILPAALGAFCGTFAAVKLDKKEDK